jgi:hypothetical protein
MDDMKLTDGKDVLVAEVSMQRDKLIYLDINDSPIWLTRKATQQLRDWLHGVLGEGKSEER